MSHNIHLEKKDPNYLRRNTSVDDVQDGDVLIDRLGAGAAAKQSGILGKMWTFAKAISKYGIEVRGIERVLPEERPAATAGMLFDNMWLWLGANCTIPTLALGMLGPSTFGLSGKISILTIVLFNLIGNFSVAFFSTFGPKLGLRQMTITRFSFGYYVTWFPVVLNTISCIGSGTINSIVGAQALRAVSTTHQIPTAAAIVLVALLSFVAPFFGYKVVHTYERYSWIPVAIIFLIILGMGAKDMNMGSITNPVDVRGGVLSFGAASFGFGMGWSTYAADYTVQLQDTVSSAKLFWITYVGLSTPLILIESLGVGLATATRPDWQDVIASGDVGGLIGKVLAPTGGFAKFCLVIMALSIIAINVPIMYSFALTFQVFGRYAQAIPRIFLVTFGTAIYIMLAIVGASHFNSWLDTLLVVLSYWLAIYCSILIEEHFIFRKGRWSNYNVDDYNEPSRLPLGIAALISMCFGIVGAVMGMATLWYVGVLGRKVGNSESGGDIGFELSLAFTAILYPPLRAIERRWESPERHGKKV